MELFSRRNKIISDGFCNPKIRLIDSKLCNCLCSCIDMLYAEIEEVTDDPENFINIEKHIWIDFLYNRLNDYHYESYDKSSVVCGFLQNESNPWYLKLDLIEKVILFLRYNLIDPRDSYCDDIKRITNQFVNQINHFFKSNNYGYRIVNDIIVEINDENIIQSIENTQEIPIFQVQEHLNTALRLLGQRPMPDVRNSIKESISAVEAYCRLKTKETTLGQALNKLEKESSLNPTLKQAFDKLYGWTCSKDTGIRHAYLNMDEPIGIEEARFMLITCSAFINYLYSKFGM